MTQNIALQGLLFVSGLMAGVLLESRVFQPRRDFSRPASVQVSQAEPLPSAALPATAPPSAHARIQVDEPVYRFGTADSGTKVEHVFLIRNTGREPLTINQVQAACGCTATNLAQRTIEPGEATELKAILDLSGRVGSQNSVITIKSNDAQNAELKVSLVGNAINRIAINPAAVNFGRIGESVGAGPRDVTIQINKENPFSILKAEGSDALTAVQLEELTPSARFRLAVSIGQDVPAGPYRSTVKLLTDHPDKYRELTIPVQAYVGPGGPLLTGDEPEINGPTVGGGTVDLKDRKGKVCVVVFWAGWCGYCQKEIPELLKLYETYHSKGLEILGVNIDKEAPQAVAAVEKWKLPWPNIHFAADAQNPAPNPLMDKYQLRGIPSIVLIGRDGKVDAIGLRNTALASRIRSLIESGGVARLEGKGEGLIQISSNP